MRYKPNEELDPTDECGGVRCGKTVRIKPVLSKAKYRMRPSWHMHEKRNVKVVE